MKMKERKKREMKNGRLSLKEKKEKIKERKRKGKVKDNGLSDKKNK